MQTDGNLFRPQAVAFKSDNLPSSLLLNGGKHLRTFVWLGVLSFIAILALLAGSKFKETERARGILKPEGGLQKLPAPRGARVAGIFVEVGQRVEKGQVLAQLSNYSYDNEGIAKHKNEIARLTELNELIDDELLIKEEVLARTLRAKQVEKEGLLASKQSIRRELNLLAISLKTSERNLRSMETLLENEAISRFQFDQQQTSHLGLGLQQEELRKNLQTAQRQIDELDLAEDLAALEVENTRLRLRNESKRIDYEISHLQQNTIDNIVAENTGEVVAITIEDGQMIRAGEILFYLLPENKGLQAEIYVSSRIQGRIEPGQRVMFAYDGFDYQSYGRYEGTVIEIGQVSLDPREHLLPLSQVPPVSTTMFRIVAALDQEYVEGPDIYRLQRDMELSADFVVAEMSLLAFIFKPLLAMRGKIW